MLASASSFWVMLLIATASIFILPQSGHTFDDPNESEILRAEVPIGENGELGHIEVTVGDIQPLENETQKSLARRIAQRIKNTVFRALRHSETEEIDSISGIEDPRNTDQDFEDVQSLVKELGKEFDVLEEDTNTQSLDLETASDISTEEVKPILQRMFSKSNIAWAVFRFFGTGGVMTRSIVINEGASAIEAIPIALTAGLLSAGLQVTNPFYGDWAVEDPFTNKVLDKYGSTPLRRLGIDAAAIWIKWGLVLEGIFLTATELSRLFTGLGPAGFEPDKILLGITLTTLTQGTWEIVGVRIRKNSDLKANIIAGMASLTYAAAAGYLLVENYAMANTIFAGLGITAWSAAGWIYRDWVKSTFEFYRNRASKLFDMTKLKEYIKDDFAETQRRWQPENIRRAVRNGVDETRRSMSPSNIRRVLSEDYDETKSRWTKAYSHCKSALSSKKPDSSDDSIPSDLEDAS